MNKQKYTIDWFTICYNESKIIPIAIQYWKYIGARHITVYDNGSTDGSLELFAEYPDWITVIPYDTGGKIIDRKLQEIKNNCWKNSDADFCVVGDFDEIPFCEDFDKAFDYIIENNYDIVQGFAAELISEEFPNISDDSLIHEQPDVHFTYSKHFNKSLIFRPDRLKETDYTIGAHFCEPVDIDGHPAKSLFGLDYEPGIFTFHLKKLGMKYMISKYNSSASRLSEENIKKGWGGHYSYPEQLQRILFHNSLQCSTHSLQEHFEFYNRHRELLMILKPNKKK